MDSLFRSLLLAGLDPVPREIDALIARTDEYINILMARHLHLLQAVTDSLEIRSRDHDHLHTGIHRPQSPFTKTKIWYEQVGFR